MSGLDYTRYYSKWHPDTEEHFSRMRDFAAFRIRSFFPDRKNERILDVGCGAGFVVAALVHSGYSNATGIDIDKGQVERAQRYGLPVERVDDTIQWLRGHSQSFRLIFCFDVIEHIPVAQQIDFAAALACALQDGGRLVCSVPNANSALEGRYRYGDFTHSSSFTEHSLDFLLYHGGFREIIVSEDEPWKPRFRFVPRPSLRWWYLKKAFRFLRRIQFMAELGLVDGRRAPLSLNLLAVAKK